MTTPEPQSAAPEIERPRFQFTLRTLLLLFVVLGSSLAVFGAWGVVVFGLVVGLAVYLNRTKTFRLLLLLLLPPTILIMFDTVGLLLSVFLPAIAAVRQAGGHLNCPDVAALAVLYWPNIAALAVWLLSVGTLLTHAVRSRKTLSPG